MNVLYVEDDPRDADVTTRVLRKTAPHLNVETLSTVQEATSRLERLSMAPLDLVLLDFNLRDGDGLSLLAHIRERALPVAVVMITGLGDEETAVAALKARADDYVVKRKHYLEELPLTLESALNHYRADAARRAHPLRVLYAEYESEEAERTRLHFAVHADHLRLEVVSSSEDALKALQGDESHPRFDVVLLGFHRPGLDALEVLKQIRLIRKIDVPVVLVCTQDEEDIARHALKLGNTRYLIKQPGYLHRLTWELEDAYSRAELMRREGALRESEERFRTMADTAPVLVWMSGADKRCTYFNQPWLEFTGRTIEQELGTGWTGGVHPEDLERCLEIYSSAFDTHQTFRMEYRRRRYDGQYRWVLDTGVPRFVPDGRFAGFIGSTIDITERIEAENEREKAKSSLEEALVEVQQLKDRLHVENAYLQEEIQVARNFGEMVGYSETLQRILAMAEQVAPMNTTALILGETGTGKEMLAHAIHKLSPRRARPLVVVNCAALPSQLIESELFGHERGAFTGAAGRRIGRFEIANGGTILLDEIGELPLDLQSKLLRVLEEGEFEHLGSSRTVRVDVRIIAATNRNLEDAVRAGLFRPDLFYRLNVFPITLPPLRERREDIPMLVAHFVTQYCQKVGKEIDAIPEETMVALQDYRWPGNVRELRNVIERATIISQGRKLRLLDSLEWLPLKVPSIPAAELEPVSQETESVSEDSLEESQYKLILRTLEKTYWRVEGPHGAAALLKVHPNTLRSRMRKLGISKPKFKLHP